MNVGLDEFLFLDRMLLPFVKTKFRIAIDSPLLTRDFNKGKFESLTIGILRQHTTQTNIIYTF